MQRVTMTLDDDLMTELDRLIELRGYASRSEAIRDVARAGIQQAMLEEQAAPDCVAILSYVYSHETRDLARRITAVFRDHHDLSVATMQLHLNHANGLEVALLKGRTADIRHLADQVLAERGVRNGQLVIVPTHLEGEHTHGDDPPHTHVHVR